MTITNCVTSNCSNGRRKMQVLRHHCCWNLHMPQHSGSSCTFWFTLSAWTANGWAMSGTSFSNVTQSLIQKKKKKRLSGLYLHYNCPTNRKSVDTTIRVNSYNNAILYTLNQKLSRSISLVITILLFRMSTQIIYTHTHTSACTVLWTYGYFVIRSLFSNHYCEIESCENHCNYNQMMISISSLI